MAEIFHFKPRAELEADHNLKAFIELCRSQLTVFGTEIDWDLWEWKGIVQFTKLGVNSQAAQAKDALDADFINFSKAYFRYQQGHRPTGAKNELKAVKSLERALLQVNNNANIAGISISVLDEAAKLIRENYAKGSDYHGGRELERLAKFVSVNRLVPVDVSSWKNPIARKRDDIQTGQKAKERREKKLPNPEALNALAEIFANNPKHSRDIFTSATFAMLMCAPSRISEVLELPVDCEVEERDSKGQLRYGWRFYSGKGFGGDIKWIPTEMVSIAKEAIKRIKTLGEEGRQLALWREVNPHKFFPRKGLPKLSDDAPLTEAEVAQLLGWNLEPKIVRYRLKKSGYDWPVSLDNLWEFVMSSSRQPKDFPWLSKQKNIKYSQALFCMTTDIFNSYQSPHYPVLWAPTNNNFNNDLNPTRLSEKDYKTIFDRHSYRSADGARLKLTSHQARHLLNTIAQRGGLSNLEIAKWSGRANTTQNRVYNHMSEYEMVAQAEELDKGLTLFGPLGEPGNHPPITIQEFNTLEKGPVHVTEFGVCVHDFTLSPCEKFRDCINCSEQVCIKGQDERYKRIKERLTEVEKQYNQSLQAMENGLAGADRWYEYHKNTLQRLRELVGIFGSSDIADGALIKLRNDKEFSPLRRAIASRLSKPNEKETKQLEDMAALLGGGLG